MEFSLNSCEFYAIISESVGKRLLETVLLVFLRRVSKIYVGTITLKWVPLSRELDHLQLVKFIRDRLLETMLLTFLVGSVEFLTL